MRKRTHEQFMDEFYKKNTHAKDIEILGTYVNSKTKIRCRCKIDGHEWDVLANDLLRGRGCFECATRGRTKTHEQFIQELQQINTDIEVLGTYVTANTKIKVRCKIDGYEWETQPSQLLLGSGCPICYENRRGDGRSNTIQKKKYYN